MSVDSQDGVLTADTLGEMLQQYLDEHGPLPADDTMTALIHQDECLSAYEDSQGYEYPCNCLPVRLWLADIERSGAQKTAEILDAWFMADREARLETVELVKGDA